MEKKKEKKKKSQNTVPTVEKKEVSPHHKVSIRLWISELEPLGRQGGGQSFEKGSPLLTCTELLLIVKVLY